MYLGSVCIDVTFPSNIWLLNKMGIMRLLALHIGWSFNFIRQKLLTHPKNLIHYMYWNSTLEDVLTETDKLFQNILTRSEMKNVLNFWVDSLLSHLN